MPIIASFEDWKTRKAASVKRSEQTEVTCTACEGDGEVECDCGESCCKGETLCDRCDGTGKMSPKDTDEKDFGRAAYFTEVVTDIKAYCLWTSRDFLAEVGPFVSQFRLNR